MRDTKPHALGVDDDVAHFARQILFRRVLDLGHSKRAEVGHFCRAPMHMVNNCARSP